MKNRNDLHRWSDDALLKEYKLTVHPSIAEELLIRYQGFIYNHCRKFIPQKEICCELAQAIMEKAFLQMREVNSLQAWLRVVIRNECLNYVRKMTRDRQEEILFDPLEDEDTLSFLHDRYAETCQQRQAREKALEDALKKLRPHQRLCLELFYFEGKSYSVIARQTGFTQAQVKSFIQNGKKRVKYILSKSSNPSRSL